MNTLCVFLNVWKLISLTYSIHIRFRVSMLPLVNRISKMQNAVYELFVAGNVNGNSTDLLQSRVAVTVTSYNYQIAVLELSTSTHIASGALISTTYALSSALGLNGFVDVLFYNWHTIWLINAQFTIIFFPE